jgi:predicted secreted protein
MTESELPAKISTSRDEDFNVQLESNPTSGFRWQFVPVAGEPELINETTVPNSQAIGGPASQIFTFRASTPGTYKLVFELRRSWESSASSRKEIIAEVK